MLSSNTQANERRTGQTPVPDDMLSRLTEPQHQTLARLMRIGWSVKFVRRPLFQTPVFILYEPKSGDFFFLHEGGTIDKVDDTALR
jgi:hypothetical protein